MGASTTGARESRSDRRSRRIWPSTPVARRQFGARPAFTADEAVNAGRAAKSRADRRDRSTRRSMPSARRRYPPRLRALTPPRTGPPPGPPVNAAVHRARRPPREPPPRPDLPSMPQFNGPEDRPREPPPRPGPPLNARSSTDRKAAPGNRPPPPGPLVNAAVQQAARSAKLERPRQRAQLQAARSSVRVVRPQHPDDLADDRAALQQRHGGACGVGGRVLDDREVTIGHRRYLR